jgi:hypothetical protein
MSMQSLNQLVARSIVDPGVVQSFSSGNMTEILNEMELTPQLRSDLGHLEATSFVEFAIKAYRIVKAAEMKPLKIELPSPVAGLMPDEGCVKGDQAA